MPKYVSFSRIENKRELRFRVTIRNQKMPRKVAYSYIFVSIVGIILLGAMAAA
jgi:hypothetical protein